MPLHRCLIIQIAIAAAIVLAVGTLNWWVDPFGLFGNNRHGFYFSSERQIKQGLAIVDDRSGIVMGSSKVAEIDPDLIGSPVFLNGAWSGALPEEMLYFLRERGLDRTFVAIGLDFFMFNEAAHPFVDDSVFARFDPERDIRHTASLMMLWRSLRAVQWSLQGRPSNITPRGARNTRGQEKIDHREPRQYADALEGLKGTFANYSFSRRRLDALRQIKDWSEDHCVPLVVFINPLNRQVRALIARLPAERDWARFKAALHAVFPDLLDLTDGAYDDPDLYWRRDPFHYYPSTAARFFERELGARIASKTAAADICQAKIAVARPAPRDGV